MKCKVQLIGRLGAEPEITTLPNAAQVANLSIATEEYWKDKQGQAQRRTTWHRVKFWSEGTIGFIERNIAKGQLVEIEGTFRYEEYTDREGVKNKVPVINGTNIMPLSFNEGQAASGAAGEGSGAGNGEDIPF
ncbi:single-stranded DNA-binding protein [Asticcacaulis sp. W401b]|uniref:single-stranded DNA-binding protein n=1 Tax=Asticcacaulis sp. W401b TaxID=3388666 RepID=UPI003970CE41